MNTLYHREGVKKCRLSDGAFIDGSVCDRDFNVRNESNGQLLMLSLL